eukprot:CAMPEP_0174922796 /NCGR_PEP_ID=MMETSP1355-20121228/6140_1 /TAXON_ID=464990 /ORGANISM="Hemiselmis tepida, Strain CCMP443" /LENGTH=409 /DNA_ID=CAMNT_0016168423 /DNA_START=18 /DNA_END=1243 /DNA_ORIENTATION=+
MDLEFDRSASRLKAEQKARLDKEKRKREADRRAAAEVQRKNQEMEEAAKERRLQQAEEEARQREAQEERERRTGGVEWKETFVAAPLAEDKGGGGDRITLPPSALSGLEFKGAMEVRGPMHFELATEHGGKTHGGVLEFTAEDGTVGIPPKVAACLAAVTGNDETPEGGYNSRVTATYVRLEKGAFVSLQPRTREFANAMGSVRGSSVPVYDPVRGKWVLPGLEGVLHAALQPLCALTLGDTVRVEHGGSAFDLDVVQLEPAHAVSLIDTDIQVEIAASREEQEQLQERERAEAEATARRQRREEEAGARALQAAARLAEEPPEGAEGAVAIAVRLPDGRRFTRRVLRTSSVGELFDFIDAGGVAGGEPYQLVAAYPRRVFDQSAAGRTWEELGVSGPQEALFLESLAP